MAVALPVTVSKFVAVLKVRLLLAPALPELLNSMSVLAPGTTKLPEMLPENVP